MFSSVDMDEEDEEDGESEEELSGEESYSEIGYDKLSMYSTLQSSATPNAANMLSLSPYMIPSQTSPVNVQDKDYEKVLYSTETSSEMKVKILVDQLSYLEQMLNQTRSELTTLKSD